MHSLFLFLVHLITEILNTTKRQQNTSSNLSIETIYSLNAMRKSILHHGPLQVATNRQPFLFLYVQQKLVPDMTMVPQPAAQ